MVVICEVVDGDTFVLILGQKQEYPQGIVCEFRELHDPLTTQLVCATSV